MQKDPTCENCNHYEMDEPGGGNPTVPLARPVPKQAGGGKKMSTRMCAISAGVIIATFVILAIVAVIAIVVFRPSPTVSPTETSSAFSGSNTELQQELESLRKLIEQQANNFTVTTKEAVILSQINVSQKIVAETKKLSDDFMMWLDVEVKTALISSNNPNNPSVCSELSAPDNGDVVYSNQTLIVGTTATFSCDPGFVLFGEAVRTCYTDTVGNWSGKVPSCDSNGTLINCQHTNCRQEQLVCPEQDNCTIRCYDSRSYPCYRTGLICPREGDCALNCDGTYACLQTNITCPEGGNCLLNCMGEDACRYASVVCPSGGHCVVHCQSSYRYTCSNSQFTCPSGGNCIYKFEGLQNSFQVQNLIITCEENSTCSIKCTGQSNQCSRSRITCPTESGDCSIECSGNSACRSSNIACGRGRECLSCSGRYSCSSATIILPNTDTASLNCSGSYSCGSATITLPSTTTASLSVSCTGEYSCQFSNIQCPDNYNCTIKCGGRNSCRFARITCPTGDYSCNILCTDPLSCPTLRITNTDNVNLRCCGDVSCSEAPVTPTSRTECLLR